MRGLSPLKNREQEGRNHKIEGEEEDEEVSISSSNRVSNVINRLVDDHSSSCLLYSNEEDIQLARK